MNEPLYTIEILRLAATIPHQEPLQDPHGRAELRSRTCGSKAFVSVRLDPEGRLAAMSQQVQACAFGQASAALMGRSAIGRQPMEVQAGLGNFAAWLEGEEDQPGRWPGLHVLEPARSRRGRHAAMLLPFRALLAAMENALEHQRR